MKNLWVAMAMSVAMVSAGAQQEAQEPPPPPRPEGASVMHVNVQRAALAVIVRDKAGNYVSDLTKDDFVLKEDGKPVPIGRVAQDKDLPLTIGLLVDTSGSQVNYIEEERKDTDLFFRSMLTRDIDRAFLVRVDYNIDQLAAMTNSKDLLLRGLKKLEEPHEYRHPGSGGTLLYDSVCAVSQSITGKEQGRRAMVILTDGVDSGSSLSLKQAIGCAQRADTVVYTILYTQYPDNNQAYNVRGEPVPGMVGRQILEILSSMTGGRSFIVRPNVSLEKIYAQLEEELRNQYQLVFRPPSAEPNKYHTVELVAKNKKLQVQTRTGYFSK